MYRVRSTDVWYNMPGVVAAYQPVACPGGPLLARVNVSNEQRTPGRYAAVPGVSPTHDPRYGWTFNGTTQYLETGLVQTAGMTVIARYSGGTSRNQALLQTGTNASADGLGILPGFGGFMLWLDGPWSGNSWSSTYAAGVVAVGGGLCYWNGEHVKTTGARLGMATFPIPIGASRQTGAVSNFFLGSLQAAVFSEITLTPAHVAQYSRQMAYCHVNPDWSAWGRRRRYYYAPSAAALAAWRGVGRNSSPVGGSIGVHP